MIWVGAAVGFLLTAPLLIWALKEGIYVMTMLVFVAASTALVAGLIAWVEAVA